MATKKTTTRKGFSDFERAAMQERAKEILADKDDGESMLLAKIAEMDGDDKALAERLHEIMKEHAPMLKPKTWYGMPAYADKEGKSVCFFQAAKKFKARYATLGFNDNANLDDGDLWPTSYALKKLTPEVEKKIVELVTQAVQ